MKDHIFLTLWVVMIFFIGAGVFVQLADLKKDHTICFIPPDYSVDNCITYEN